MWQSHRRQQAARSYSSVAARCQHMMPAQARQVRLTLQTWGRPLAPRDPCSRWVLALRMETARNAAWSRHSRSSLKAMAAARAATMTTMCGSLGLEALPFVGRCQASDRLPPRTPCHRGRRLCCGHLKPRPGRCAGSVHLADGSGSARRVPTLHQAAQGGSGGVNEARATRMAA